MLRFSGRVSQNHQLFLKIAIPIYNYMYLAVHMYHFIKLLATTTKVSTKKVRALICFTTVYLVYRDWPIILIFIYQLYYAAAAVLINFTIVLSLLSLFIYKPCRQVRDRLFYQGAFINGSKTVFLDNGCSIRVYQSFVTIIQKHFLLYASIMFNAFSDLFMLVPDVIFSVVVSLSVQCRYPYCLLSWL